jgi:hypothetical protein
MIECTVFCDTLTRSDDIFLQACSRVIYSTNVLLVVLTLRLYSVLLSARRSVCLGLSTEFLLFLCHSQHIRDNE